MKKGSEGEECVDVFFFMVLRGRAKKGQKKSTLSKGEYVQKPPTTPPKPPKTYTNLPIYSNSKLFDKSHLIYIYSTPLYLQTYLEKVKINTGSKQNYCQTHYYQYL
jgi:hypothetical protein